MIVLNTKTFDELKEEATSDLEAVGFNSSPGAVAKLFMNIVNKNIANLYRTLTVNHLRAFVTTSDGDALDAIGLLLQCFRLQDESDDNYRYRITQQCLTLATSNETAVRLTTLITDGVRDCVTKPYIMGAGSFGVIILTDEEDAASVVEKVRGNLLAVHGYGIRYDVDTPDRTYIKIKQHIVLSDRLSDAEKQEIRYQVQTTLADYFNTLRVGESIIIDKITQEIMNVSPEIIQEMNEEFYINGEKAIYVNQSCRWRERFVLSTDIDNIIIT